MSDTVKLSAVGTLKATLGAGKINVNDYTLTVTPVENGTNISITRGSQTDTVFVPDYSEDEAERKTAEEGRVAAETARVTAEDARAVAEAARESAESARADAETKRTDAETARATAEAGRDAAETARVKVEGKRVTAESARETAEAGREAAEKERGVDIAELKTDVSAIRAGDTERDTRLTAIESKDAEQDDEISTLKTDSASHAESISAIESVDAAQDTSISALRTDVDVLQAAAEAGYELIETIVLSDAVDVIERTQTPSGDAYNYQSILVNITYPSNVGSTYVGVGETDPQRAVGANVSHNVIRVICRPLYATWDLFGYYGSAGSASYGCGQAAINWLGTKKDYAYIGYVKIYGAQKPVDTKVQIYALRA